MTSISATKLRSNLFEYLAKVAKGESIAIKLNGITVGKIVPLKVSDWRQKIKTKSKLNKNVDETFAPLDGIWKEYL